VREAPWQKASSTCGRVVVVGRDELKSSQVGRRIPRRAAGAKKNYKVTLEYDGSLYHGWQRQRGVLTIQEVVETCLETITCEPVRLHAAGRTDAGVHACGQVANFHTRSRIPTEGLFHGLNSLLPSDIVALKLEEVPLDFHARFKARSKLYQYRVHNGSVAPALGRQYAWHIRQPLDWQRIEECLQLLVGRHDFASFKAAGSRVSQTERTIIDARISKAGGDIWIISLQADGFLRHMVRTIVGTLMEAGRGKLTGEDFAEIVAARDRRQAGMTAPARGLFLRRVFY